MTKVYSLKDASEIQGVSTQATYLAIKKGRLKCVKNSTNGRWMITQKDIDNYAKDKYSRKHSKINGQPIFDHENGLYSVIEASTKLKVSRQRIYYILRMKYIPSERKKTAWVFKLEDLQEYIKTHTEGCKLKVKNGY